MKEKKYQCQEYGEPKIFLGLWIVMGLIAWTILIFSIIVLKILLGGL